jgi:7,8-dihydro-6-hydroxymethylpterin dimethyltransferase
MAKTTQSERKTLTGAPINPIPGKAPYRTVSLCPECAAKVEAQVLEKDGKILMEKTCPEYGFFKDILLSDAEYYHRVMVWNRDVGRGVAKPAIPDAKACPDDCGMCNLHVSHPVLANVDLTNRCNLSCPICFANANVQDYIYLTDISTRSAPTTPVSFSAIESRSSSQFPKGSTVKNGQRK